MHADRSGVVQYTVLSSSGIIRIVFFFGFNYKCGATTSPVEVRHSRTGACAARRHVEETSPLSTRLGDQLRDCDISSTSSIEVSVYFRWRMEKNTIVMPRRLRRSITICCVLRLKFFRLQNAVPPNENLPLAHDIQLKVNKHQ